MLKAITVAHWFVLKNNAEGQLSGGSEFDPYDGITHLKLQKLLYYSQGIHLALTGNPLFDESIYAWTHGPVVEPVYQHFKRFKGNPIDDIEVSEEVANEIRALSEDETTTLELTYDNFAIYTAWQLRNLTHADGSPWDVTMRKHGNNAPIPRDMIRDYFLENIIER